MANVELVYAQERLSKAEIVSDIFSQIELIENHYRTKGITYAQPTNETIEFLKQMSLPELLKIRERAQSVFQIMSVDPSTKPLSKIDAEIDGIKRVLNRIKLRPVSDLYSFITEEDVIEIYNASGFQLYHNMEWLKHTSYSLLDVMVYTFQELFERPSAIIETIWNEALRPFKEAQPQLGPMKVPEHTLRERLSPEGRCFVFNFKYNCPLVDDNGKTQAILITAKVQPVDLTAQNQLQFI